LGVLVFIREKRSHYWLTTDHHTSLLVHNITDTSSPKKYINNMNAAKLFSSAFRALRSRGGTSSSNNKNATTFLLKTTVFTSIATLVGAFSMLEQRNQHPVIIGKSFKNAEGMYYLSTSTSTNLSVPRSIANNFLSQRFLAPKSTLCASAQPSTNENEEESTSTTATTTTTNEPTFHGGDPTSYYYEKMAEPPQKFAESHAILGALRKPGYVERYTAYRRVHVASPKDIEDIQTGPCSTKNQEVCVADIRIGKDLNGHEGIVHGGIISLMIDDTFGWGYQAMGLAQGKSYGDKDFPMVVTANLSVNYRAPLPAESNVVIRVRHENTDGRKITMSARLESHDGSILYSEATALFITVGKQHLS
jgi:acyl-coenzyme A thioesterase PaaI-like protein